MSVTLVALVAVRPFAGYVEPGLPAGYWHFRLATLGDASGGILAAGGRFQQTGAPAPSLFYSLEQLMVNSTTSSSAIDARLQMINMDPVPEMGSTGALSDTYALELLPGIFGVALADPRRILPLFMGHAIDNDGNAGFTLDVDNGDGLSIAVRAQGYFWTPGAIHGPGGLRRPADGLYR